uniref:TIMELESS-interacting protein n=1 Tax=Caenorhabditis japonica TaxID=281687 RepID=A0A8R1HY02_CAEJA
MDEMDDFFGNDDLDDAEPMADEAIEDNSAENEGSKRTIEPKLARAKKLTNTRLVLNERTLTGPTGISALKETFKDFKPDPKNDPYANLEKMMKKYAYWAHLMFPNMKTEDVLSRVETLGTRKHVKLYVTKQRLGMDQEDDEREKEKEKSSKDGKIIDDGAEDDDELTVPTRETETPPPPQTSSTKETLKALPAENFNEEDEYQMMEEERRREEQEAKEAEEADELMADFDTNNDW